MTEHEYGIASFPCVRVSRRCVDDQRALVAGNCRIVKVSMKRSVRYSLLLRQRRRIPRDLKQACAFKPFFDPSVSWIRDARAVDAERVLVDARLQWAFC